MQAGIQKLRSQHGINQRAVDLQACLAQKLQIEFSVMENLDVRGRGKEVT
jgi:hypothetical protein